MTPNEPSAFGTLSLEHTSTVDRVAEELRRAVFDGELESGTALREVALAESLGVSRSTVREALAVLVGEGLATREPNRGVHVAEADPDSVRDVCRARAVLEEAGVRRWPEASEHLRDEVRRALAAYAAAEADGASYQQVNEKHLAVHRSLVGLLDSPRLAATAESLSAELRLTLAQVDRIRRNALDQAGSHTEVLSLLEQGDVEGAADQVRRHLADAEVAILAALGPRDG
ncbi:GntR family transcriptional regulator [Nocardioides guangzhouensis]|uniref:GntR family transcriptional regulator n=1 Tax=Nocardioides guangzhouensis TaxID=2497878 RepID=A0A4Q4ZD97_9ACTN|nr:GntR family transcriptional regulator [Nocardioides guangzhouensis]RYP85316.1 GntR family transcriptional regulator [Nocardioides guangzhouensis]